MNISDFMPHGMCIRWLPEILIPSVLGDLLMFVSYLVISLVLLSMLSFNFGYITAKLKPLAYLFGVFIFSCGLVHLFSAITIWYPIYQIQALVGLFAGLVSAFTAGVLFKMRKELQSVFTPKTNVDGK